MSLRTFQPAVARWSAELLGEPSTQTGPGKILARYGRCSEAAAVRAGRAIAADTEATARMA